MNEIKGNIEKIIKSINNKNISLAAVTKNSTIKDIKEAINSGVKIIGENRIQEAELKYNELKDFLREKRVEFHFIGHLQTNKVKKAVEIFDLIQSVDSLKLAEDINKRAKGINKVQRILIQVNIGEEPQKYGFKSSDLKEFLKIISSLKYLKVKGMMCITPYFEDKEKTRPYFKKMKKLFEGYKKDYNFKYLSMGMTNDYEIAIEEGSNMVRIGRGIFGK